MIGRQFLGVQAQETLEHQIPGGPLFQLTVREVIEELQADQLEHEHRVPGVPPGPVPEKVFQGRFDKGKIYRPGKVVEEMGAPAEQLVVTGRK